MSAKVTGAARAARLLVRLRLRRLLNQLTSGFGRFRSKQAGQQRQATASKNRTGWFVASLVAISMLFSFTNLAVHAVSHLQHKLGSTAGASEPVTAQGWLGIEVNDLTKVEAEALGWERPRGAKVMVTSSGSPAAKAGLQRGDIITALDDRGVSSANDLIRMVNAKKPDSVVELTVLRDSKRERHRATLGQRIPPPIRSSDGRRPLPAAHGYTLPQGVLQGCILEISILLVATLLLSLASREFAAPDWDLEWLITFPASLPTLLGVRILERALVNTTGLLALWPTLSVIAWQSGYRFSAPVFGLIVTLLLLVILASLWTVIEIGLRLNTRPQRLRNLQAIVSITAVGCLYLAMSAGMSEDSYVLQWAQSVPSWMFWLPPSLAVAVVASATNSGWGIALLQLILQICVCLVLAFAILGNQLRSGVVSIAGRETGRGSPKKPISAVAPAGGGRRILLSAIQAREILLLGRDRNFLVQTLILPVVILGGQAFLNAPGGTFTAGLASPEHVAAAAFAVAAYALMFSAFQTLNAEGQALWILYSVPRPIEAIVREKALLWGAVCLVYALAVLGLGFAFNPALSAQHLERFAVVIIGVPIFAAIGASLGVFACDPLAQLVQRRVRPSYLYLYMLLATLYVYAIYASDFWQRMGLVVLTALLAMALWQKARDQLPYLLDPEASPPSRVSVADGLIAALLFFVAQGFAGALMSADSHKLTGQIVVVAFAIAGAITYASMRFAFWRLKTAGVPRAFGRGSGSDAAWGLLGGALAAAAAFAYLQAAAHTPLLENARQSILTGRDELLWLLGLTVIAAPVFEEFIFRGLIYGGLRRSLGLAWSVIGSAAIFALVHPAASVIPVFGLGVAAALVYERTGFLFGPMVAHAAYNAAVVTYGVVTGL